MSVIRNGSIQGPVPFRPGSPGHRLLQRWPAGAYECEYTLNRGIRGNAYAASEPGVFDPDFLPDSESPDIREPPLTTIEIILRKASCRESVRGTLPPSKSLLSRLTASGPSEV